MPSSALAKKATLKACDTKGERVYELGSGWGGVAFAIARLYPNKEIHAFELSWLPYLYAFLKLKVGSVKNLSFHNKNFFKTPLHQADQVLCYLSPRIMQKLQKKFEKELKPGTLIISNYFSIPGWTPEKVIVINDFWSSKIYLYRIGKV